MDQAEQDNFEHISNDEGSDGASEYYESDEYGSEDY
jgi:hypothetical protein